MQAASEAPAIPDHVPAHLVYDFHIFGDERYKADPYTFVRRMLGEAPPVFWSPRGECWYVTRYAPLIEAFKRADVFSNVLMPGMPDDFVFMPYPLSLDAPRHAAYAAPLKAAFSPQSMAKLQGAIRELAVDLIDKAAPLGRCDFMEAVAEPLPILIFLSIMGLPQERFAEFRQIAVAYLGAPDQETMFRLVVEVDALMCEFIEARRKQPTEDLISRLWSLELEGKPVSFNDMRRYALMLFSAGLDSVTNGMGHAMHHLARDPELQVRLREHPDEIPAAAEELLRRHGVTTPPRRVAQDVEFHGAPLKTGDRVEMFVIAGNLDEAAFSDADQFKMGRSHTHLTFGFGAHRCIGAHLARIELHVLYQEWLKRIPQMRLDPDRRCAFDPGHVLRITTLPLVWDAQEKPA
jgi:cytochrome P450